MNNLKRVFSLVLALVMVVGLVMVGAGAVEFTDQEKITHTEAVDTMNALGVILGNDDSSYRPTDVITRGEMCTIIARILNGGKLPAVGSSTAYHFTDIATYWGRNYVEYCANLGIVDGRGDGTFAPDDEVTAAAAAKMLLVAAGYKADIYGFTGRDWELNTNSYANRLGIYDDVDIPDTSKGLNRDDAAQLAYNTLDLNVVEPTTSQDRATGNASDTYQVNKELTVLGKYFQGAKTEYAYLVGTTYDAETKTYTYTFDDDTFGARIEDDVYTDNALTSTKDYSDLYGQKVEIIYRKSASGTLTLYGLAGKGNVLFSGAYADVTFNVPEQGNDDEPTATFNKVNYSIDDDFRGFFSFNAAEADGQNAEEPAGYIAVRAIDNDGDKEIDAFVYTPVTVGKVDYVSSTTFYLENSPNVKKSDVTVYDGMAKGDWVKVTTDLNGKPVYEKIDDTDIITGTVDAAQGDTKIRVDGTYYDVSEVLEEDTKAAALLKADVTLILVNGKVAAMEEVEAETTATKFAVVTDTASNENTFNKAAVRVLLEENTDAEWNVSADTVKEDEGVKAGDLVAYKGPSSGLYTLVKASDLKTEGKDEKILLTGYTDASANEAELGFKDGKITSKVGDTTTNITIADGAVVFVQSSNGSTYSVIDGKTLKTYSNDSIDEVKAAYTKTVSSTKYEQVVLAYVKLAGKVSVGDEKYAWVTSEVTTTSDGIEIDILTADGEVKAAKFAALDDGLEVKQGSVIEYTENSDGTYTVANVIEVSAYAVTKYDPSTGDITFGDEAGDTQAESVIKSGTPILYIDSANWAGSEGAVKLATTRNEKDEEGNVTTKTVLNVLVSLDGDETKTIAILLVDTSNSLSDDAIAIAANAEDNDDEDNQGGGEGGEDQGGEGDQQGD